jgi:hypothetical protein
MQYICKKCGMILSDSDVLKGRGYRIGGPEEGRAVLALVCDCGFIEEVWPNDITQSGDLTQEGE